MTGWERIMRTLEFKNPDRVPVDLWVLPAAKSNMVKSWNYWRLD